jgi:hypothetical protein
MGISKFMIFLIIFTIVFLFVEKDYLVQKVEKQTKPTVSFFDSIMYEITESGVKQIVKSKQADIYKNTEKLYDATIVSKANQNSYDTNIISSREMVKFGDKVFLTDKVNLQFANGINVKTEQLNYNLNTKVADNDVAFEVTRGSDTFIGNNLFLNSITKHIKAEKTKFRMKVNNE